MSGAPPARSAGRRPAWPIAAVAGLTVLILAFHGRALSYGLTLDDHAHYRQLREADWSLASLSAACRLDLVGGSTLELWWLPDVTLRFFRPVAFGLMKLTYTLLDWRPAPMHAVGLLWHLVVCVLLLVLLHRLGGTRLQAWVVAALFAIHPGHVATVQWTACQTELMVTAFLLGATLCFGRFRGWPGFVASGLRVRRNAGNGGPAPRKSGGFGWAVASAVLFALALGCRENAVLFPLVVAVVEPLCGSAPVPISIGAATVVGRRGRRSALVLYGAFAALTVAYLWFRAWMLGGLATPPRPYVIPPGDPDFLRYVADKTLYYLLGEFFLLPCVPIGGLPWLQDRPLLLYGLGAIAVVLVLIPLWLFRREPGGRLAAAWLLGFMLPVLPVFASPHHLYLPGIGWAIGLMLVLRAIAGRRHACANSSAKRPAAPDRVLATTGPGRSCGRLGRGLLAWTLVGLLALVFGVWSYFSTLTFETGVRAEECMAAEIAETPGLQDGDTLYLANMPLIAHYMRLAVEERTGLRNLRLVPLTWSPRLLGPATPTECVQVDEHTIEIRVAGDRYFGGPLGRLIREATGRGLPDHADRSADLGFVVDVLERDADGVAALRFRFTRTLDDPRLHLFWGSRARWACPLTFDHDGHGRASVTR
ncbi:MAG: hypothetical protein AB1716_01505 [Planctomycetota bacterium]